VQAPFAQTIPPTLTEELGKVNGDEELPGIESGVY
jgi:hypothetical protein